MENGDERVFELAREYFVLNEKGGMKRERRQPTPREWQRMISDPDHGPVVRRIPRPSTRPETPPEQVEN